MSDDRFHAICLKGWHTITDTGPAPFGITITADEWRKTRSRLVWGVCPEHGRVLLAKHGVT